MEEKVYKKEKSFLSEEKLPEKLAFFVQGTHENFPIRFLLVFHRGFQGKVLGHRDLRMTENLYKKLFSKDPFNA